MLLNVKSLHQNIAAEHLFPFISPLGINKFDYVGLLFGALAKGYFDEPTRINTLQHYVHFIVHFKFLVIEIILSILQSNRRYFS